MYIVILLYAYKGNNYEDDKIRITSGICISNFLNGCTGTGYIRYKEERTLNDGTKVTKEAGVEGGWGSLLKPAMSMLADLGIYTFDDWDSLNPAEFKVKVDPDSGFSTIRQNSVELNVYSNGNNIGSQSFPITLVDGYYIFENPQQVKDWSYMFIDVADKGAASFTVDTVAFADTNVNVEFHEHGELAGMFSYQEHICGGGNQEVYLCD